MRPPVNNLGKQAVIAVPALLLLMPLKSNGSEDKREKLNAERNRKVGLGGLLILFLPQIHTHTLPRSALCCHVDKRD